MIVRMRVHVAWWVKWYIGAVAYFAHVSGATPDTAKLQSWIRRGLSIRVEPVTE
jgi:hypothetical protein